MHDTDAVLVRRVQGGDAQAFGTLVERHLQAAYAVALANLGEPADAEDVAQEAFIGALQRIEQCRKPDQFGAWLLSIVRNRAHDYRRYRAVRQTLPLDEAAAGSGRDDPARDLDRSELRAELIQAVRSLSDLQREVLLLYDFEGWSHRELAERLGISEGSARVHLHNGRRALRERLAAHREEEGAR